MAWPIFHRISTRTNGNLLGVYHDFNRMRGQQARELALRILPTVRNELTAQLGRESAPGASFEFTELARGLFDTDADEWSGVRANPVFQETMRDGLSQLFPKLDFTDLVAKTSVFRNSWGVSSGRLTITTPLRPTREGTFEVNT